MFCLPTTRSTYEWEREQFKYLVTCLFDWLFSCSPALLFFCPSYFTCAVVVMCMIWDNLRVYLKTSKASFPAESPLLLKTKHGIWLFFSFDCFFHLHFCFFFRTICVSLIACLFYRSIDFPYFHYQNTCFICITFEAFFSSFHSCSKTYWLWSKNARFYSARLTLANATLLQWFVPVHFFCFFF